MKLSELKPLENNPFPKKNDKQLLAIGKSIKDFEKMMSIRKIVVDEENTVLGGNKRYFALKMLGYKEIPDDWVQVVTGLTEEEKREFIVKDNAHWGSEWDFKMLKDWGVDLADYGVKVDFSEEKELDQYTKKIESPVYSPRGVKPSLNELVDTGDYEELIAKIERSKLSNSEKGFLKLCATRFLGFHYDKIADYYANSPQEVQGMFEELALVIIDFEKAIEKGFVKLSETLAEDYLANSEEIEEL